MQLSLARADESQYTALYGIMALAGEHMHRALKLSHWHPFPPTERLLPRLQGHDVYAVYADDVLVGTFNISEFPEPYYLEDMSAYWQDDTAEATYFSGFAILPSYQQKGIGTWCMNEAKRLVREKGTRYMRFDAVAHHEKLLHFYTRLGYRPCGKLPVGPLKVMCFEKDFG